MIPSISYSSTRSWSGASLNKHSSICLSIGWERYRRWLQRLPTTKGISLTSLISLKSQHPRFSRLSKESRSSTWPRTRPKLNSIFSGTTITISNRSSTSRTTMSWKCTTTAIASLSRSTIKIWGRKESSMLQRTTILVRGSRGTGGSPGTRDSTEPADLKTTIAHRKDRISINQLTKSSFQESLKTPVES